MWGWFGGSGNAAMKKNAPKTAIINLREQLEILQKREAHLEKQIAEQDALARKHVSTNKNLARTALKRKKVHESSLENCQAQINTLEQQVHTIESATLNYETLRVMKESGKAIKSIHGGMKIDDVEATMDEIRESAALAEEIGHAITQGTINDIDTEELESELDMLAQEELDDKMLSAPNVPVNVIDTERKGKAPAQTSKPVDDEEEELRKLQAEMAM